MEVYPVFVRRARSRRTVDSSHLITCHQKLLSEEVQGKKSVITPTLATTKNNQHHLFFSLFTFNPSLNFSLLLPYFTTLRTAYLHPSLTPFSPTHFRTTRQFIRRDRATHHYQMNKHTKQATLPCNRVFNIPELLALIVSRLKNSHDNSNNEDEDENNNDDDDNNSSRSLRVLVNVCRLWHRYER